MLTRFEYTLHRAGWASAEIADENGVASIEVSYLNDPLFELLEACNGLLDATCRRCEVVFMDEPGEHVLTLVRGPGDEIVITLDWFDEWREGADAKDVPASRLLRTAMPLWPFCKMVQNACASVLNQFGMEGYRERWVQHDFPVAELEKLQIRMNLLRWDGS